MLSKCLKSSYNSDQSLIIIEINEIGVAIICVQDYAED